MKKNLLFTCVIICPALSALPADGFYISAGGGGKNADLSVNHSLNVVGSSITFNNTPKEANQTALMANIAIGGQKIFRSKLIFSLESQIELGNVKLPHNIVASNQGGSTTVQSLRTFYLKNTFDIVGKIGYLFAPTTNGYVFAGRKWTNFTADSSLLVHAPFDPENPTNVISVSNNNQIAHFKSGLTAGAGVERYITSHASTSLEYNYCYYHSLISDDDPQNTTAAAIVSLSDTYTSKAQTNSLQVKITYHFG